jgi:hypothetical protein
MVFALSVSRRLEEPRRVLERLREIADVVYVEVPDGVVDVEGELVGVSGRGRKIVRVG